MRPQTCFNTVTIRPRPFETKIDVAAEAGFEAIGLWSADVADYLKSGHSMADLTRRLRGAKLKVAEVCATPAWQYLEKAERKKALDEARRRFEQCAELKAGCIIAPAAAGTGDLARAVDDFVTLCEAAAEFNVRVAFEFIYTHQQFRDMASAWDLVLRAEQPNGGLVLDTHHFHMGRSRLEDISRGPGAKVFLVHISDTPDEPIETLTYMNRLYPGTGAIRLREIMGELAKIGCACPLSVEIFNEACWKDDPKRVAAEAKETLEKFIDSLK